MSPCLRGFPGLSNHKYCYMVSCMKTTIDLPDRLLIDAKKLAAEERTTLRNLMEQGLKEQIASRTRQKGRSRIKWVTARGGLPEGLDIRSREEMIRKLGRKI